MRQNSSNATVQVIVVMYTQLLHSLTKKKWLHLVGLLWSMPYHSYFFLSMLASELKDKFRYSLGVSTLTIGMWKLPVHAVAPKLHLNHLITIYVLCGSLMATVPLS